MQKQFKILHITPTDARFDGRILKELDALRKLDYTDLRAFGIRDDEGLQFKSPTKLNIRTFRLFGKKLKFLPRPIRYFLNLIEAIFQLTLPGIKFRPHVVHCHDTLFLPIALLIKLFSNCLLIYDAHELESDKSGQSRILSKYTLFIEKLVWNKIDFLISVSPSILKWYEENLGNKENELILNSPLLNHDILNREKNDYLRYTFQIPKDAKIFIYLGIMSKKGRGLQYYLDVFTKKDIQSHIVFVGFGEYEEKIKSLAIKHENIHYHEPVAFDKVVDVAKSADVGLCLIENVSLSTYYCLPNKLFEYAFSGVYILASDFPDMRDIVTNHHLGKCTEVSESALHKAVKNIETEGCQVQQINLEELGWQVQEQKLLKIYNFLLTNKY